MNCEAASSRQVSAPEMSGNRIDYASACTLATQTISRGPSALGPSVRAAAPTSSQAISPSTASSVEPTEYELLGLLAPGQSVEEFRSRIAARATGLQAAYPVENCDFARVQTFPFHSLGLMLSSADQVMRVAPRSAAVAD